MFSLRGKFCSRNKTFSRGKKTFSGEKNFFSEEKNYFLREKNFLREKTFSHREKNFFSREKNFFLEGKKLFQMKKSFNFFYSLFQSLSLHFVNRRIAKNIDEQTEKANEILLNLTYLFVRYKNKN